MSQNTDVAPGTRDEYMAAKRYVERRNRCTAAWLVDRLVDGARVPVCRFEEKARRPSSRRRCSREVAGIGVARRRQMPLRLAWALSVHKSQGMGLKQVRFDPAKTFDDGQVYVALSRATTMEGLSLVSRVLPRHLRCDSRALRVVSYLDSLLGDGTADVQLPAKPPRGLVTTWEQRPPKIRRRAYGACAHALWSHQSRNGSRPRRGARTPPPPRRAPPDSPASRAMSASAASPPAATPTTRVVSGRASPKTQSSSRPSLRRCRRKNNA